MRRKTWSGNNKAAPAKAKNRVNSESTYSVNPLPKLGLLLAEMKKDALAQAIMMVIEVNVFNSGL